MGVRDALEHGDQCPQPDVAKPAAWRSWVRDTGESENCLVLNVWTPGLRDERKRPVMVWFHGGGFALLSGSSPAYDGERLSRRGDVVVVTLNHRVNVFGYLSVLDGRLRSGHALEIPLVFDTVGLSESYIGAGAPEAQQIAQRMSEAWIAFARTGNPSTAELRWPAYDFNTRSTMIFNVQSTVAADPRSAERQLLASLPEIKHLG